MTEDLQAAIGADGDAVDLRRRRVGLERAIHDHTRRAKAGSDAMSVGVGDAIDALGDHVLLEYAAVDAELVAVSVIGGRARLHELGSDLGLADDIDAARIRDPPAQPRPGLDGVEGGRAATLDELVEGSPTASSRRGFGGRSGHWSSCPSAPCTAWPGRRCRALRPAGLRLAVVDRLGGGQAGGRVAKPPARCFARRRPGATGRAGGG